MEAEQRPEWKDISDRGPIYKSYWAQCKSLGLRDGVLNVTESQTMGRRRQLR
jgi:hypothetical protein